MTESVWLSPLGKMRLIVNNNFLIYCNWEEDDCNKKLHNLYKDIGEYQQEKSEEMEIINDVEKQLTEYFKGERKVFELPIMMNGTEFRRSVWRKIAEVSYGKKLSYGELAAWVGKPRGSRAVANACGANPIAIIIPCHRITGSNGYLGGYTGGIEKKKRLLEIEQGISSCK